MPRFVLVRSLPPSFFLLGVSISRRFQHCALDFIPAFQTSPPHLLVFLLALWLFLDLNIVCIYFLVLTYSHFVHIDRGDPAAPKEYQRAHGQERLSRGHSGPHQSSRWARDCLVSNSYIFLSLLTFIYHLWNKQNSMMKGFAYCLKSYWCQIFYVYILLLTIKILYLKASWMVPYQELRR